jgi:chromate reductase
LGILIATPEYNGTFSGIIKNAFDWLSDSFDPSPLTEKKIGIVSASYLT